MKIISFRTMRQKSLIGLADVELPSGVVIHRVAVWSGDSGPFATMPRTPEIGRDGAVMKDAAGNVSYRPVLSFTRPALKTRFSNEVVAAMRATHPEALS
jgi:hypothetical protein